MIILRHDLAMPMLLSGIYFGLFYTGVIIIWFNMFPDVLSWWNLDIFGGITIFHVPLGEILFGKLKLPGAKKTKTGYSTSQDILEGLSNEHPLPKLVLEYRSLPL